MLFIYFRLCRQCYTFDTHASFFVSLLHAFSNIFVLTGGVIHQIAGEKPVHLVQQLANQYCRKTVNYFSYLVRHVSCANIKNERKFL